MAVNKFTDLTADEFKTTMVSGYKTSTIGSTTCDPFVPSGKSVPDSVDWRTLGVVTPVKDQGQCGSCWSFSATGALEGAWAVSKGKLVSLSEQQLVDCAGIRYGSMGCNGGLMDGAFNYAIDKGMCSESSYAYTSGDTKTGGTCQTCAGVVKVSKCYDVKTTDQVALKEAVSTRPVSIAIEADTKYFQSYSSGVLTSTTCGTNLDHGVLIVGYGEENGQKYWLVKNSWGDSWGDSGYVKIARSDSSSDGGVCGVSMEASFVVI
jgi:KDEL-tailed cysteine endopeptidase